MDEKDVSVTIEQDAAIVAKYFPHLTRKADTESTTFLMPGKGP